MEDGKEWFDFVNDIYYKGHHVNLAEYGEEKKVWTKKERRRANIKKKEASSSS